MAKRYRVKAWPDWPTFDPTVDERYDTEAEARAYARTLTEPLIDLIDTTEHNLIGIRRAVPYPGHERPAVDTL
jgi:hypothetical protein